MPIQTQIAALEAKIRELRAGQLTELQGKLKEARRTVAALESQIAEITGNAPPNTSTVKANGRKRMSEEEIKGAILKALASTQEGMSGKEISDVTGVNYQTILKHLKGNAKSFKTTGASRSKRFFLK